MVVFVYFYLLDLFYFYLLVVEMVVLVLFYFLLRFYCFFPELEQPLLPLLLFFLQPANVLKIIQFEINENLIYFLKSNLDFIFLFNDKKKKTNFYYFIYYDIFFKK